MEVFGDSWGNWITAAAKAAGCPADYVVAPLLASASALIGNARWAQAKPGWREPPHLWLGDVGDSGTGKSPGSDCLIRDVLPELERRMLGDFPDRLREWQANIEMHAARHERWKADVRTAQKDGHAPPLPPADAMPPEPQAPRLRQNDVTIEKVATILATATQRIGSPRDESAGWLTGMKTTTTRSLVLIEAYGGRSYRVERQKNPQPIMNKAGRGGVPAGPNQRNWLVCCTARTTGYLPVWLGSGRNRCPFASRVKPQMCQWAIDALVSVRNDRESLKSVTGGA